MSYFKTTCPNCGFENDSESETCIVCGVKLKERLTEDIVCPECGKTNNIESETCFNCGFELQKQENIVCPECGNILKKSMKVCPKCNLIFEEMKEKNNNSKNKIILPIVIIVLVGGIVLFSYLKTPKLQIDTWYYDNEGNKVMKFKEEDVVYDNGSFDLTGHYLNGKYDLTDNKLKIIVLRREPWDCEILDRKKIYCKDSNKTYTAKK